MGSLMAGWSTSPSASHEVLKRSSSSLTQEEVQRFWRSRKLLVKEHLEEANKDAAISPRTRLARAMTEEIDEQNKLAEAAGSVSLPEGNSGSSTRWWTKSRWAFLNDPPTMNFKQSRYVPQFEVATIGQLQIDSTEHPSF